MLRPWGVNVGFNPSGTYAFKSFPTADPSRLAAGGFVVSTVLFCDAPIDSHEGGCKDLCSLLQKGALGSPSLDKVSFLSRTLSASRDKHGNLDQNRNGIHPHFREEFSFVFQRMSQLGPELTESTLSTFDIESMESIVSTLELLKHHKNKSRMLELLKHHKKKIWNATCYERRISLPK